MKNNIVEILFENAKKFPNKLAIIHKNEKITYSELSKDVKEYANYFLSKGLKNGDNVLIFVPMTIELYKILSAIFYIGATAVFVDAWADKNRLSQALTIVPCKAFIGCPKAFILKLMSKKVRNVKLNFVSGFIGKCKKEYNIEPAKPDTTALITFTTGSTGLPKAAKRTHEYLLEQHYVLKKHLNPETDDVDLASLPIFVLHNLACGTTSVIPDFNPQKPADINPEKIIKDIEKNNINTSVGSPRFYEKLAEYSEINGLERIFTGGAPVFPKSAKLLQEKFKNCNVEIVYGSTEAEPIASISTRELLDFKGEVKDGLFVGKPIDDINVKIIRPSDEPVQNFEESWLPQGEIGEICVEGKHVLKEYYNSEKAQNFAKIRYNGQIWHRTGDAGYIDKDDNLFLMGRVKNRFEYNGKEIYVFPIENALLEIDEIEIGTVMKIGNKIVLAIELKPSSKINEFETAKLSGFEYDRIEFLKIPRDPRHNSKIDYDKLAKLIKE
ncbi:MAG: AMP-binding protein [Candidatus Gastranaerophilaceae bacterium]|nr:AMP-binding protein [Candidatus Gastranaerophilaceae bacterium]